MRTRVLPIVSEALLLFCIVYGPLAFGCVEPWALAILEAAAFGMLVVDVLRAPFGITLIHKTLLPCMGGLLLLGFVQLLHPLPIGGPQGLFPYTASAYGTGRTMLLWAAYMAVLHCGARSLATVKARRRFIWALFLVGVLVAIIGIIQKAHGNIAVYGFRPVRAGRAPFGPYFNSDHAACLMDLSFLVGMGIFLSRFAKRKHREGFGAAGDFVASQGLVLFLLGILAVGALQAWSRGGMISLFLGACCAGMMGVGYLSSRRSRSAVRMMTALVLIIGIFVIARFPHLVGFRNGFADSSVSIRLSMYRGALRAFADSPVFGVGLGATEAAFPVYKERGCLDPYFVDHLHCDWLQLLVESGLLGSLCYLTGLLLSFAGIRENWLHVDSRELRWMMAGVFAAAVAFILHGFVDFNFQIPANAFIFFGLLSWLGAGTGGRVAIDSQPEEGGRERPYGTWKWLACVGIFLLGWKALNPAIAWYSGRKALAAPLPSRPYFIEAAYNRDPQPKYSYDLGSAYFDMAQENPVARSVLLRKALGATDVALIAEPANSLYRYRVGQILRVLGRAGDAQGFPR